MKEPSRSQEKPVGRERRARDVAAARRLAGADRRRRWRAGGQRDSMRAPMKDAGGRSSVLPPTVAIGAVVGDEPESRPRRVAGRIRPHAGDAVVLDRAVRVVAAEDADAERVLDEVVLDVAHRHLGHGDPAQLRRADAVVADHHVGHVRDDPLAAADDEAVLDEAGGQLRGERDVDPLRRGTRERADLAVADRELALAGVDPVERRRLDDDAVELDALGVAHLDPVLAAADGQVAHA